MRIGIDIDDTLSYTNESLINNAIEYDKKFVKGKGFQNKNKYNFTEMFYWNEKTARKFIKWYGKECISDVPVREDASKITNLLHDEGNEIIIITYRQHRTAFDMYELTKQWLDKNNIYYDKLIINSGPKGIVCKEENIDLFIDDSYEHCKDAYYNDIKHVLLMNSKYTEDLNDFPRVYNWNDIYKYIKENIYGENCK